MNHQHSGHPHRRSVAERWIFFPLCVMALVSFMVIPLISAGQSTSRSHAFAFHRHLLNVAPSLNTARWLNSQDREDSEEHHVRTLPQPVPIPGGGTLPNGTVIHVFAPQDTNTEPSVITNFNGFTALAYPTDTNAARDNNGNFYDLLTDMRVFRGEYVAADGSHHIGTFVFI